MFVPARIVLVLGLVAGTVGCNEDDTALTVRTQARVNQSLNTDSDVQVAVQDGVATLTGMTSSDAAHLRAVQAAKATPGVKEVFDHIGTPPSLTGGAVPAPAR